MSEPMGGREFLQAAVTAALFALAIYTYGKDSAGPAIYGGFGVLLFMLTLWQWFK